MMQPNPIQRFLGLARGADSPFDLLGLSPEQCDPASVRAALQRRMERLRRHPESLSHEADEVRLALHAAAAQLSDPAVRDQLAALLRSPQSASAPATMRHAAFRELATHVLARAGGWNRESRQWLGLLSHAHGLGDRELHQELRHIVASAKQGNAPIVTARPVDGASRSNGQTVYESIHKPRRRKRGISIGVPFWAIVSTATVAALLGAIVLRESATRRAAPATSEQITEQNPQAAPGRQPSDPTPGVLTPEVVVQQLSSPEQIQRWLDLAHAELSTDPGQAAWRFERATEALRQRWNLFSSSALLESQRDVMNFLHRAEPRSLSGERAGAAIESGLDTVNAEHQSVTGADVRTAVWSGATLLMIASDRNADSTMRRRAIDALQAAQIHTSARTNSFEDGAEATLPVIAERLIAWQAQHPATAAAEAWTVWNSTVETVTNADTAEGRRRADRIILQAAESLLSSDAHVATSAPALNTLASLLSTVRWSADGAGQAPPSWGAVLSWFDEPTIPVPDLAVATEWIVSRSGAPAVTSEMTLSRGSIVESRVALRERYARAWDADIAADSKGFAAVWARTVREVLTPTPRNSISEKLSRMALIARFNAAAALRWRGDVNGAGAIVVDPLSPVAAAGRTGNQPMGIVREASKERDGLWALRFLAARKRDLETRSNLLAEIGRAPWPLGPVDADVLVGVALQSPANELRSRAQEVARRRAAEPGIVSAMLDAISKAPRNASTTALVTDVTGRRVPSPANDAWEQAVRLALAERLLEMLAPMNEWTTVDQLSDVVAAAYAERAALPQTQRDDADFGAEFGGASSQDGATPAHIASDALFREWRDRAAMLSPNSRAPVSLEEIERRHVARQRLAVGPLQRFVGDQSSIAEAMAFVISAERPSRAAAVANVMEQLGAVRGGANSIVDQSVAAEQAMLALWALRYGLRVEDVLVESGAAAPQTATVNANPRATMIDVSQIDAAWLASTTVRDLKARLEALSPDDPIAAFNLAEELAYESQSPTGRDLARRLYELAYAWDETSNSPRGIGASVHLALADLSTRSDERRWLLAVALSMDPTLARIITLPAQERASLETRLALAEALELYRLGEYGDAQRKLSAPEVRQLLEHYEALLTGGAQRILTQIDGSPSCRECRNDRTAPDPRTPGESRLCPTCNGDPGPDVTDDLLLEQVRLELAILEDEPKSWSAALMATRGEGMREVGE